jgi:hypothetical protein
MCKVEGRSWKLERLQESWSRRVSHARVNPIVSNGRLLQNMLGAGQASRSLRSSSSSVRSGFEISRYGSMIAKACLNPFSSATYRSLEHCTIEPSSRLSGSVAPTSSYSRNASRNRSSASSRKERYEVRIPSPRAHKSLYFRALPFAFSTGYFSAFSSSLAAAALKGSIPRSWLRRSR